MQLPAAFLLATLSSLQALQHRPPDPQAVRTPGPYPATETSLPTEPDLSPPDPRSPLPFQPTNPYPTPQDPTETLQPSTLPHTSPGPPTTPTTPRPPISSEEPQLSPPRPAPAKRLSPPHIVIILADDLGWNDVGFLGSEESPTPNLDALAYDGVILRSHYSQPLCTPSRAALLTGKYPIHTGMQHNVILEASPWGLPLTEKLMPQLLAPLGYVSYALGKWHLGFYSQPYLPTSRGFHSHYGFWNGFQDYYSHVTQASFSPFEGYDMRRDLKVDWSSKGKYTTHLLTKEAEELIGRHPADRPLLLYMAQLAVHAGSWERPLAAPADTLRRFRHIKDKERRTYLGMLWELDQSVGRVISALKQRGMLEDTIVVFASDNGAATRGIHKNTGSNFPLRGEKGTPWEGAVRTPAFLWSSRLTSSRKILNGLFHISDWLPTLYQAAGGSVSDLGQIDGVSQWPYLKGERSPPRRELLHNIDDIYGYSALRSGPYKYINGTTLLGYLDDWVGPTEDPNIRYNISAVLDSIVNSEVTNFIQPSQFLDRREAVRVSCGRERGAICNPLKKPCLFDIEVDPCERDNLYDRMPHRVHHMEKRVIELRKGMVPAGNKRVESIANPAYYNNTWVNWVDPQPLY